MEKSAEHCLPITGHSFPECDPDAPFKTARCGDLSFAWSEYNAAAKVAEESGRDTEAKFYRSIGLLCSLNANFDSITEPYQPGIQWEGKRTPIPDDFSSGDLETIALIRAKTASLLLRARLGDILWICKKDHVAAKEAAADYGATGNSFLTKDEWFHSINCFWRALQLGHRMGRKNDAWLIAETATVAALTSPLASTEPYYVSHLLSVLSKMGAGELPALAEEAKKHASKALGEGDARRSRIYFDHEAEFRALAKDSTGESVARLASGMTYEAQAEEYLKRTPPSYFGASDSLSRGIEALRRANADPAVVARLKLLLRNYQQKSLKEMKTYTHEVDISQPAEQAAKLVDHPDLREALKFLAFARKLTSEDEVRTAVLKQAEAYPLSHMMSASVLDVSGRVIEHIGGLSNASQNQEAAIEGRVFKYAADFVWRFRALAYIEPARRHIWLRHLPRQSDLDFLVTDNPFVPPGHEGIFRRGLYYGLAGDMLLAAHLLAPQIENSIRFVLEQHGVDVSNLESDLTQPVKTLGPLLSIPETISIFGAECVFELKGLLIEKLGYSFRHRIAHGFVSEAECYGPECSNIWWLALRLCYTPVISGGSTPGEQTEASPAADVKAQPSPTAAET